MSPIIRSDRRSIIGIARQNLWVFCMETMEAAVMVSSQVAQATKLGSAHMAVSTLLSIWDIMKMAAEY
jgi:hypothetical protein